MHGSTISDIHGTKVPCEAIKYLQSIHLNTVVGYQNSTHHKLSDNGGLNPQRRTFLPQLDSSKCSFSLTNIEEISQSHNRD